MLSICIYSNDQDAIPLIKETIQDFLIEHKMMARISSFDNQEELLLAPTSHDIYIMDLDVDTMATILFSKSVRGIDPGAHFICISTNENNAIAVAKARLEYFLTKPIDKAELIDTLLEIKKEVQFDNIIIKTNGGEMRVRVNKVNYIDIVKRCLCYHLTDGTVFDGQILRSSFEKAIAPLHQHETFVFIAPSLLINLEGIKMVNKDNIVFENDKVLFFPQKHYETLRARWLSYNRIIGEAPRERKDLKK